MEKNDWIPVKSGILPKEREPVQVTYLGYTDNKPYCDEFAYMLDGKWLWNSNDFEPKVKIIAWKRNCEPYRE